MSILNKLKTIEKNADNPRRILLTKKDLAHLFGPYFEDEVIQLNPSLSCFVFEENGELYHMALNKEEDLFLLLGNANTGKRYMEVDNQFIGILKLRQNYLGNHPIEDDAEPELSRVNEILAHPLIRLKQLFIDEI